MMFDEKAKEICGALGLKSPEVINYITEELQDAYLTGRIEQLRESRKDYKTVTGETDEQLPIAKIWGLEKNKKNDSSHCRLNPEPRVFWMYERPNGTVSDYIYTSEEKCRAKLWGAGKAIKLIEVLDEN